MYKRKRSYKRRNYSRKGYKKKSGLTSKVNYLMKQNKVNRPQLEFTDTVGTDVDVWSGPGVLKLNAYAENSRGTIKSIQFNGYLELQEATTTQHFFRLVIFTDKSNEGSAIPGWGDVYKSSAGIDAVNSLRKISEAFNEGTRFKVIYDKRISLLNDGDAGINDRKMFKFYKKLNIPCIGATGYYEAGGLYLGFVGTTATTVCDLTFQARIRHVDKTN